MNETIPFETLSAYVDGELDDAGAAAVERAMAADTRLRDRVREIRETDATLRAALGGPLRDRVPPRLLSAIDDGFGARRRRRLPRFALPIAASIAAVVVLGAVGYRLHEAQLDAAKEAVIAAQARERAVLTATINHVLETVVSGKSVAWEVPETGVRGAVTPIRTYRSTSGHWCREYRVQEEAASKTTDQRGVACRTGDKEWRTVRAYY
jgi:anti-sigma factor RsiW